jgi:glycosyltransferase involved in cell wall biosynthesis
LNKLQQSLQSNGIETDYLSLRDAPIGRPILLQPLNYPVARKKLARCDFVHAGGDATYAASLWKPFTNARIIYDVHGDTYNEAKLEWCHAKGMHSAHQLIQAFITNSIQYRCADRFLVVSRLMEKWLSREKNRNGDSTALIRNGVDLDLFRPPYPLNQAARPSNDFVVGYAGGFAVWQGLENLVDAFERITEKSIRLRIVGIRSGQKALADKIRQRLGDRVELLARMDQKSLVSTLAQTDVLVIPRTTHPALEVAMPTKFAEYLAVAKPVIVSDVDETAQLVREHQCGLVAQPNSEDLARTLTEASKFTSYQRNEMGSKARALAESEFSWEIIGRRYADCLKRWGDETK